MLRRSTRFFTGRESVGLVQEARGLPFTVVTYFIAFFFAASGIRHFFFCGYILPWEDSHMETYVNETSPDCKTNKYHFLASMQRGATDVLMALIRIQVASSINTTVLYSTMQLLVFSDFALFCMLLAFDYSEVSIFYQCFLFFFLSFETYLLLVARKAYLKRKAMKDLQKLR